MDNMILNFFDFMFNNIGLLSSLLIIIGSCLILVVLLSSLLNYYTNKYENYLENINQYLINVYRYNPWDSSTYTKKYKRVVKQNYKNKIPYDITAAEIIRLKNKEA